MRSGRGLAGVLPLLVGGCSILFAPGDDLTGGGSQTTSSSGSPVADGGPQQDASTADAADAGPLALVCPAGALLCDDFERTEVRGAFETVRGAVTLSTQSAHSGTRSLAPTVKAGQPMPALATTFTAPSRTTASLWFRAPSPIPGEIKVRLADLLWGSDCNWMFTWQLSLSPDGLIDDVGTYDENQNPSCGPVAFDGSDLLPADQTFDGKWHHVTVTHDVSTAQRRSTVQVDERPPVTKLLKSVNETPGSQLRFSVGIPCVQTSSGCLDWELPDYGIFIDDVTVVPAQ